MAALLGCDSLHWGKRFFKIRLHLCVHSGVIEIHGVFKMQIQAAEVQIDRADNSLLRVGQIDLEWMKPGVYSKIRTPARVSSS